MLVVIMLTKAKDDLPRITDVVLNALATELHEFLHASSARRHASFLEMAHVAFGGSTIVVSECHLHARTVCYDVAVHICVNEASVRLGSSSAVFPTIRTLVEVCASGLNSFVFQTNCARKWSIAATMQNLLYGSIFDASQCGIDTPYRNSHMH